MPNPRTPRRSNRNGGSSGGRSSSTSGSVGKNPKARKPRGSVAPILTKFVLYVEGPRDREVLSTWAKRVDPDLTRLIDRQSTILGGRQPARALADFRKRGGAAAGWRGLIVLDRDDQDAEASVLEESDRLDDGLELFVWGQRHIESYLLVPEVLRRLLRVDSEDRRIETIVAEASMQNEVGSLHAKRILGAGGALSRELGVSLQAGEIARAMRREDLHADIEDLFRRIGRGAGLAEATPEVIVIRRGRTNGSGMPPA